MAPGFNGVADVADLVVHRGTSRRKVTPSLLLRLGTPGPWPVGAVAGGVTVARPCLWGVHVEAVPVRSGHHLG